MLQQQSKNSDWSRPSTTCIRIQKKIFVKLMDWADKFAGGEFETQRKLIREAITDPKHPTIPSFSGFSQTSTRRS